MNPMALPLFMSTFVLPFSPPFRSICGPWMIFRHVTAAFAHLSLTLTPLHAPSQTLLQGLQDLPTDSWTDKEIELVLAEAYRWKYMFHDSQKHLK